MIGFARRNMKIFFRDKAGVFFSFLAVLITIVLYAVFLNDMLLGDELDNLSGASVITSSWLAAGLMTTASLTTSLGAISIMIEDKKSHIDKDFRSSPIPRRSLISGYLLSTLMVSIFLTVLTFALSTVYIILNGGTLLPALDMLKILGTIILSVLTSTSIVTFLVSFLKSQSSYVAVTTIVGTLIGFLTGVYIPIGVLPDTVQTVIRIFPLTHAAALLRQILMKAPMAEMFTGAPTDVLDEFRFAMGVNLQFGNYEVTPLVSVLILSGTAALFFSLALLSISRKQQPV